MADLTSNCLLKTNRSVEKYIVVLTSTESTQSHRALFLEIMCFAAVCPGCQILDEEFLFFSLLLTLCADTSTDLNVLLH